MEAMMSIGEFATHTGLSVSALRFYADRGLLKPASTDPQTGYRRYGEGQIGDGRLIRDLRRLEMPLVGVTEVLSSGEAERKAVIEAHLRTLESVVHRAHVIAQELGIEPSNEDITMEHTTNHATTEQAVTIDAGELARALRQVLPAASVDPARPHLMGVLFEAADSSLRIVATDGHRLAVRDLVPASVTGPFAVVVAAATMTDWLDALDDLDSATIEVSDRRVRLAPHTPGAEALPIDFPDYERYLVADDRATTALAGQAELLDALAGFAGTDPVTVKLDPTSDSVTLRRDGASVDVAAATTGGTTTFAIDPTFMRQAATSAIGPELVIEADDEASPVLFRSATDGTYTSLVMPFIV